ncbi:hypothetical protein BpHYR1_012884 [Brachionus plicatilis]|uniref:Uncharacterized protein n=1 Tax=Brachionus plicatilis TaxID=10195 RepID=A0A3M7QFJ2_BRAPC|nr:hypothetical protein BpHYR1_012884 [Brachionus plicatilis]
MSFTCMLSSVLADDKVRTYFYLLKFDFFSNVQLCKHTEKRDLLVRLSWIINPQTNKQKRHLPYF